MEYLASMRVGTYIFSSFIKFNIQIFENIIIMSTPIQYREASLIQTQLIQTHVKEPIPFDICKVAARGQDLMRFIRVAISETK